MTSRVLTSAFMKVHGVSTPANGDEMVAGAKWGPEAADRVKIERGSSLASLFLLSAKANEFFIWFCPAI